jgi:hypothetical protein
VDAGAPAPIHLFMHHPSRRGPLAAAAIAALAAAAAPAPAAASPPRLGIMADAGVPDGATASVVVRPYGFVRLHGGVSYNGISNGVRGGITLLPLPFWFTPTLSVDYGRYFEGDANPLVRRITGDGEFNSEVLERIGYDYVNAHAGLAFGRRWVTFYLQGGATRVVSEVHNLNTATGDMSPVTFTQDPRVKLTSVSARLGLVVYLPFL